MHLRPRLTKLLVLLGLVVVTACGSDTGRPGGTPTRAPSDAAYPAIAVHYTVTGNSSDGPIHGSIEVVTAGANRVRVHERIVDVADTLSVWDGDRLLVHDASYGIPWMLYEAPAEHPDQFLTVRAWRIDVRSASFDQLCRHHQRLAQTRTIAGRHAQAFRCGPTVEDGVTQTPHTIWIDTDQGLLLAEGPVQARTIDPHARVESTTFSTEPPKGADVDTYAPRPRTGTRAADFQLSLLDGGTARLSQYAGAPLVVAFFSSDLAFDPRGEDCRRCIPALLAVQSATRQGRHPAVLGIENGDKGKPGMPLLPAGLEVTVANDPRYATQHAYGLDAQVAFAFITSDGTVQSVINGPATDRALQDAVAQLG